MSDMAPMRRVRRAPGGGAPVMPRERRVKRYGSRRLPVSGTPEARVPTADERAFLGVISAEREDVCPQCMDDPAVAYCGRCGRREPTG